MSTVFIGGSRKISRLPQGIEQRLDTIMSNRFNVIVGDATGADKAVQKYLLNAAYDKVTVFCSGHSCRNNLGEWQAKLVTAGKEKKGFQFYAAKDREMAKAADFGLMIWDGESPGTLLNILRLIQAGKKAVLVDAPHKDTFNFTTSKDWQGFINRCDLQLIDSLRDRAVGDELRLLSEHTQTNWLDDTPHLAVSGSTTDDASEPATEIDTPSKTPVSIELAAKASLDVKVEIPKESMGRTLDALVDIIRPFTEARGLRADQLRLQRQEIAFEIARIAKKTAELDDVTLSPPPVKFLVPFLERASLEDTDPKLHSRWAALLVSASRNYEARHLTYIDILSRLSSDEISILEEVCIKDARFPETWRTDSHLQQNRRTAEKVALEFNVRDASTLKSRSIFLRLIEDQPFTYGRIMSAVIGGLANLDAFYSEFGKPTDTRYKSLEILERERLIEFGHAKPSGAAAEVSWFSVSNLGLDFAKDCSPSARRD